MKKYLIVLAVAALTLASCNPNGASALKGISFKEASVDALVGDTIRLVLLAEPEGAAIPADLIVESSDTSVVKVIDNNVNVAIVGSGTANITAKAGELTAVCKVSGYTYLEAWYPDWLYYFPSSKTLISDEIIELSGYKCQLYSVKFFVPSALDFPDGTGEGYALWFTAAIPFIAEGEYKDEMLGRAASFTKDTTKLAEPFAALAGVIDPELVGPACQEYLISYGAGQPALSDNAKALLAAGNYGAGIYYTWSDEDGVAHSYFCDGVIAAGWMQLKRTEDGGGYVDYEFIAQWGWYAVLNCLAGNPDASSWADYLAQPYALDFVNYYYKTGEPGSEIQPNNAPAKGHKVIRPAKSTRMTGLGKPERVKFVAEK